MQRLTPSVIKQLNNLPGFPAIPNTNPPSEDRWVLGDYLNEIKIRPGVAVLGNLPVSDNVTGDVRFVVALGSWYWWDGAAWQPVAGGGGGVATVTASAPLASSGGANPNISFPSWPADAAGSLANDGAGNLSWIPVSSGGSVDVASVSTVVLAAGEVVRFTVGGVQQADANAPLQLEPVGFSLAAAGIGVPVTIRTAGVADVPVVQFDVAPIAADVGKRVWLSTMAGKITLTAPSSSGEVVQRVGILVTLAGGGGGEPQILVQVGDPVLLA